MSQGFPIIYKGLGSKLDSLLPALIIKTHMKTFEQGNLGVLAANLHFAKQGYFVFNASTENAPCDLVLIKDGKIETVEVKTTRVRNKSSTGWVTQIKQVRPNKTENIIKRFNTNNSTLLCIHIVPVDKVFVIETSKLKAFNSFNVHDIDLL